MFGSNAGKLSLLKASSPDNTNTSPLVELPYDTLQSLDIAQILSLLIAYSVFNVVKYFNLFSPLSSLFLKFSHMFPPSICLNQILFFSLSLLSAYFLFLPLSVLLHCMSPFYLNRSSPQTHFNTI